MTPFFVFFFLPTADCMSCRVHTRTATWLLSLGCLRWLRCGVTCSLTCGRNCYINRPNWSFQPKVTKGCVQKSMLQPKLDHCCQGHNSYTKTQQPRFYNLLCPEKRTSSDEVYSRRVTMTLRVDTIRYRPIGPVTRRRTTHTKETAEEKTLWMKEARVLKIQHNVLH